MTVQNWWARLTGRTKPLSPDEAELRRLSEEGDRARQDNQPDLALELYQQGLETARRQGSLTGQDVFLGLIGALQTERGRYEEAEQALNESVQTTEKIGDPGRRARAMGNLGAHYLQRGLPQKAQTILEQALTLARQSNDTAILGLTLANLGGVYLKEGNASYALRLLKEAADRLQTVPASYQSGGIAFAVGQLGQAHLMMNEADRGFRLLTQAIRLAQQAKDTPQELRWTNALAQGLFNAGQLKDAMKLYERCEEIVPTVRNPDSDYHQNGLINEATICHRLNQNERALGLAQRALTQARSEADRPLEARVQTLLADLYRQTGHIPDAIRAAEGALDLYKNGMVDDKSAEIDTLLTLGMLHQQNNEADQGMVLFNQALEMTGEEGGAGRAKALRRIGNTYSERGDLQKALENWTEAGELFEQASQYSMAARIVCDIGAAKRQIGGINMALPEYERATMLLNNVKDAPTRGLVLSNVANLYTDLGEVETASSFFQESLQLARQLGDRRSETVRLGNYAWFYLATGRTQDAIRLLEEALTISRSLQDDTLVAVQTNNLGLAYHAQKDYTAARGLFGQALALANAMQDTRWKAVFQTNLARTALAEDKIDEAVDLLNEALPVSRAQNDQENVVRALVRLAEVSIRRERPDDADRMAREGETLARKWGYRKGQADALVVRSNVMRQRGDLAEAERLLNEAIKLYSILHDPLALELAPKQPAVI